MATQTWIAGRIGNWFDPTNWTSGNVPTTGDLVLIGSGTPTIASGSPSITREQIVLGGSQQATLVTLQAIDVTFSGSGNPTDMTLTVSGGDPSAGGLDATFQIAGDTSFSGQIYVQTINGGLTIHSGFEGDGTSLDHFVIENDNGNGLVLVSHGSYLQLTGDRITNHATIEVDGYAEVDAGLTLGGSGYIILENGGHLSVEGTVTSGQQIDFEDGTGLLTITETPLFSGQISLSVSGARIDLTGLSALLVQSQKYDEDTDTLILYSGPNETGAILAQLSISGDDLDTADFKLSGDGDSGTLITYVAQGITQLYQSLRVPVVASAGTMVSLSSMLMQSFGTDDPGFYGLTLLPAPSASKTGDDVGYWVKGAGAVTPVWYVNGNPITGQYVVQPGDDVQLLVGNSIKPASIQAQVTPAATGSSAEFVTYDVYTVDPAVAAQVSGAFTPAGVIASALSFNSVFGHVPNTNYCYVIADNVGAGAGAPIASQWDYALEPTLSLEGGFWRIAYDGSASPSPPLNWSTLVQPGDIVAFDWLNNTSGPVGEGDGHVTTVLAGGGPGNTAPITVYDNVYQVDGNTFIGIHHASYWTGSDPATVVIYRLDPNQQYLIQGTSLAEVIQGSLYDNLIQPGGGADIITGGPGDSEFQDTTANLNGITVTDFNFGDQFDFTDLDPAQVTTASTGGVLQVFNDNVQIATVALPGVPAGQSFTVTSDGSGGSLIELDPLAEPWTLLATGDFNGDGIDDVLWQVPTTGATVEWLMSTSGGIANSLATPPVTGWTLIATGDFNGDGIDDLMWQNASSGATSEWLMSPNGGLAGNPGTPPVTGWTLVATGDFNGDGIDDFMWQNGSNGATSEWLMSPNGGLASNPFTLGAMGWNLIATGHFNGDGVDDLMWRNAASGATSEWLMSPAGGLAANPSTPGVRGWNLLATGDFNGDGVDDLMWENTATGATSEWLMSPAGGLAGNPSTPGAQGWELLATGDFNGDGTDDLMWQNATTGATSEWLMSPNGGLAGNPFTPGAQDWNLVATGDFNGDGIEGLLWQHAWSGATSEWLMSPSGGLGSNPFTPTAAGMPGTTDVPFG